MNDRAKMRFFGLGTDDGSMPAIALGKLLLAWQKALKTLAEGHQPAFEPGSFKPGAAFRRRYELRARLLVDEPGVFDLTFGPAQRELALSLGHSPAEVWAAFADLLAAIEATDSAAVAVLVPDEAHRRRILREIQRGLPKPGDPLGVEWAALGGTPVRLVGTHHRAIERWIGPVGGAPVTMSVIGELVGVDFVRGSFAFRYPPTGRVLSGAYAPEAELRLLKSRRKLVTVGGTFVLDSRDHPVRLVAAHEVTLVDLAPLVLDRLEFDDYVQPIVPPFALDVTLDAAAQRFEASDRAAGIAASAPTRDGLLRQVVAQIEAHIKPGIGSEPSLATATGRFWQRRLAVLATEPD